MFSGYMLRPKSEVFPRIWLGFWLVSLVCGQAAVTRGPYLQQGTPSGVTVRWRTDVPTESQVRFGTNVNQLGDSVFDGAAKTEHELRITGLQSDTRYYYSVGSVGGTDYFFLTAPNWAKPTRIWVLGDSGTANVNARAVRDAYYDFADLRHTDLWLMLGDNAYGGGSDEEYTAAVFDIYPTMLQKSVLWPALGNHETYSSPGAPPYLSIFSLPTEGEAGGVPSGSELYYSFDYGNIHFVCLDSMTQDRSTNGAMAIWLNADLFANTNEWLIAFWHHPPYSRGSHNSDVEIELIEMRQTFLPILEEHGVDLVLCGHSHSYERSYLLNGHYGFSPELNNNPSLIRDHRSGRLNETGPYVKPTGAAANAGAVYVVAGSSGQTSGGQFGHPAMFVSLDELGSLVLDINGDRLSAQFLQANGVVGDQFTILKGDAFRITSFRAQNNSVTLTWRSQPGRIYYVDFTPTLANPTWTPVSGGIIAQGTQASWTGLRPQTSSGFYRVVQLTN